jgi:hypothetical protein
MARRRRPETPPESEAPDTDPITPAERLDPRAVLMAPPDVQRDPEALLRWAAKHLPWSIRSEAEVSAARETRAALETWRDARREARRRGLSEPDLADYLPG